MPQLAILATTSSNGRMIVCHFPLVSIGGSQKYGSVSQSGLGAETWPSMILILLPLNGFNVFTSNLKKYFMGFSTASSGICLLLSPIEFAGPPSISVQTQLPTVCFILM